MAILKKVFRIFNGTSWDKVHFETDAGQVRYTKADGTETDLQTQITGQVAAETRHVTLASNWCTVTKAGYALQGAYTKRDDTSYYVAGISRHSNDSYVVIIAGGSAGMELDLYLVWGKL